MKKILMVFLLLLASCGHNNYKYSASSQHFKAGKVFYGYSDSSMKEAMDKAISECQIYYNSSNRKILYGVKISDCLPYSETDYSDGDGETILVWEKNPKVIKKKKEERRVEQARINLLKQKKLKQELLEKKRKYLSLEASFGEACTGGTFKKGFTKGTKEYEDCLFEKEKEAIAKQKVIDEKLAKMTPVQRREYNCEETFKFRKGSDKFKDCVFKLYTTELELQKLELQKEVAMAKLEAEKAKAKAAATEKARADAVARAQIAAAEAQKAAARSQSLATSMSLMQLGSSMMSSPTPAPSNTGRVRTTCRNVGGFLNCY